MNNIIQTIKVDSPDNWEKKSIQEYEKRKESNQVSYIIANDNYFNSLK